MLVKRLSKTGSRLVGALLIAVVACNPLNVQGQARQSTQPPVPTALPPSEGLYPELRLTREFVLAGTGAGLLVVASFLELHRREVPEQGLPVSEIALALDRTSVGRYSRSAEVASDWTRNTALLLPIALTLAVAPNTDPWDAVGRRGVVYAETLLISLGATVLGKNAFGRPRPYSYLSAGLRPDHSSYDITSDRTFRSMPSGHSSSAWTGAAITMTEHLLSRPGAGWPERAGVGFLAGALGGTTSALRVAAGQHFPSDVLAGAAVGLVTGVAVPLLHRGERPIPSVRGWLPTVGGALGGTLLGLVVARGY